MLRLSRRYLERAKARFWIKVNKKGSSECWEWQAERIKNGYGRFRVKKNKVLAHRFSWFIHFGTIPKNKEICHSCDNRVCVNPKHLWIGTHDDNMKDMASKGRGRSGDHRGEKHALHILTEKQVLRIRKMYRSKKYTQQEIANEFEVCRPLISMILNYKRWGHIV